LRGLASGELGLEDLGDGAPGADAGWYGGEARHDKDRGRHHGEQLPEGRDGRITSIYSLDQSDAPPGCPGRRRRVREATVPLTVLR
jgi:hypothetical protein